MPTPFDHVKIPLVDIREVGVVKEARRGIARITGLPSCVYGQLVQYSQGTRGIIVGFDPREVLAIILGDEDSVSVGDSASSLAELLAVPVGEAFVGRVVNGLGEPIDDKGPIPPAPNVPNFPVFLEAPGVMEREPVTEPMTTGIKIVDLVIPIGKGQRELIIGDRQSGKSSIGIDAVLNQRGKDIICIFCWIGGPRAGVGKGGDTLPDKGAMAYTIVVSAAADVSAAEQYVAPYAAAALGEYFMYNGKHVLLIFDDLTKHAWIYRQMSLLLERAPGREAYPGDIFYLHSQLLEKAGKLRAERGGGSMTFLPLIETLQGDIAGYIQTNLISITDGQLYVNSTLFREGFKPAIDLGLSVSRIGSRVQHPGIQDVSGGLRLEYIQYREMLRMTKLRTRLSDEALQKLKRGETLRELLMQPNNQPIATEEQIVLFYAFKRKVLEALTPPMLRTFIGHFFEYLTQDAPTLVAAITETKSLTADQKTRLDQAIVHYARIIKKEEH